MLQNIHAIVPQTLFFDQVLNLEAVNSITVGLVDELLLSGLLVLVHLLVGVHFGSH